MKKLSQLLLALLLLCPLGLAQGSRYENLAMTTVPVGANGVQVYAPVPGMQITVCASPAVALPCTNTVTTYSDEAMTHAQSNPIVADAQGNFGFFAPAGSYSYTMTTPDGSSTTGPYSEVLGLSTSGGDLRTALNVQTLNGVRLATLYAGADIGVKVNAAFADCTPATPCRVFVPRGIYTYATTIIIPGNSLTGSTLELDAGAALHYTGTGYAIETADACYDCKITGGYIYGTAAAMGGIEMHPPTQQVTVEHVVIMNFSTGDGIINKGVNVVSILDNTIQGNLIGLHLIAGNSGAFVGAPNAVRIFNNRIIFNTRWGIIVGDVQVTPSGGSTQAFNTVALGNDLEGDGETDGSASPDCSGPSSCGAILDTYTVSSNYQGNYFEANPHSIVLGALPFTDANYQRLYGVNGPNNGTASGAYVVGNFFNTPTAPDVEMNYAAKPHIEGNSDYSAKSGGSGCSVDGLFPSLAWVGHNNFLGPFCTGTIPGLPTETNSIDLGNVTIAGATTTFKGVPLHVGTTAPPGSCTVGGSIWINTGGTGTGANSPFSVCRNGTYVDVIGPN